MRSPHPSSSGPVCSAPAPPRWRRLLVLVAGWVAVAALLAGCSGSGDSTSAQTQGGVAPAAEGGAADSGSAASQGSGGASGAKAGETTTEVAAQKLVRNATLSLQVKDIGEATAKVRAVNVAADGVIISENIGSYRDAATEPKEGVNPSTYAVLVISVPVGKLDATLDELQNVGKVLDRRSDTENVTAEYVDVQARVGSMNKSVARVQDLIDQTNDIDQLMRLEQELSQRQADLEAVEARLASLDRQTARSPITINLATEPDLIDDGATPAEGFVGGLKAGWKAFVASLVALMAIVGALLPFVLFAALVGIPLIWLWRRVRARRPKRPVATAYYPPPGPSGPSGPHGFPGGPGGPGNAGGSGGPGGPSGPSGASPAPPNHPGEPQPDPAPAPKEPAGAR